MITNSAPSSQSLADKIAQQWIVGGWQHWSPTLLKNSLIKSYSLDALAISEYAPANALREVQSQNFQNLMEFISQRSPFWKNYLEKNNVSNKSYASIEDIKFLPIIDKIFYRKLPRSEYLIPTPQSAAHQLFTSGTSGVPFTLFVDDISSFWRYLYLMRGNRWAGYQTNDYFVRLARPRYIDPTSYFSEERTIFMPWDNVNYFSTMLQNIGADNHLTIYAAAECFRVMMRKIPKNYLRNIRAILVSGESISKNERSRMEAFFQAPVFESYASREFGWIGQECEYRDGHHINAEKYFVEITDELGNNLPNGAEGKVVITDTKNFVMPFLRYALGDTGYLSQVPCGCGRILPRLYLTKTNTARLFLSSGSYAHPHFLFQIIEKIGARVLRYQIIQETPDHFLVLIAPFHGFSDSDCLFIKKEFKKNLGEKTEIIVKTTETEFIIKYGKKPTFVSLIKRAM